MSTLSHQRIHMDINVVPFVDIMLVLLIVFMITVPLWVYDYRITLPKGQGHVAQGQGASLVISLDQSGVYYLDHMKQPYPSVDALLAEVQKKIKASPQLSITVEGDQRVPYGHFVSLVSALEGLGIKRVGLAIDPDHAA
jgi:biopolymer transport protein TolR